MNVLDALQWSPPLNPATATQEALKAEKDRLLANGQHVLKTIMSGAENDDSRYREEKLRLAGNFCMGGMCMKCMAPYVKKTAMNKLAIYEFYIPGCGCYPRCPRCGHVHDWELETGNAFVRLVGWCTYCQIALPGRDRERELAEEVQRKWNTSGRRKE